MPTFLAALPCVPSRTYWPLVRGRVDELLYDRRPALRWHGRHGWYGRQAQPPLSHWCRVPRILDELHVSRLSQNGYGTKDGQFQLPAVIHVIAALTAAPPTLPFLYQTDATLCIFHKNKKQYKQIPFYTPGFVTPGLAPAPMGICSTPGRPSLFHRHHCSTTKSQREDKRPDALRKDAVYLVGHSCPSCWTAQSLASSRCFRPGRPSLFHPHHCSTTKAQREDKRPDALRKDAVHLVGHPCPSCRTAQSLVSSR